MSTLWDWLIERQRTKQMVEWRKSVDEAEEMVYRLARSVDGKLPLDKFCEAFRMFVEAERCPTSARLDLEEADKVADEALARLRAVRP